MSTVQCFRWLSRTGQLWKLRAEVWTGLLCMANVYLALLALPFALVVGPTPLILVGGLWAIGFSSRLWALVLKYHRIRCPRCQHNPTRHQAGGSRIPEDELHERLAMLEVCPACGDGGAM